MKLFIPFTDLKGKDVVILDALHPQHLTFSHWKGANIIKEIAADTSGEIALNAIHHNYPGWNAPYLSANHFDIDGFVAVFSLMYPELAMKYREELVHMAEIGDFRHYLPKNPKSDFALKLCCWMNQEEKKRFYRPFGIKDELKSCQEKFDYFLKVFPEVLINISRYEEGWKKEYQAVQQGLKEIINKTDYSHLGLLLVECSKPIPYYALFSESQDFDMIISTYSENKYELEYKYTTWIDLASRPSFPRINLKPLAAKLNELEKSSCTWFVDVITDTGPILRLEEHKISKADRYANPNERKIYSSSIPKEEWLQLVINYLESNMPAEAPSYFWTWEKQKNLAVK